MRSAVRRLGMFTLLAGMSGCGDDVATPRADAPAKSPAIVGFGSEAKDQAENRVALSAAAEAVPAPRSPLTAHLIAAPRFTDSVLPSMVIRTGQAEIEVDSLGPAIRLVERLASRVGGFVANSAVRSGAEQRKVASLQIKVPASRYQEAMTGLDGIGKLISSTTDAQDVGEEFVDVTARMSNARRLEERLVTLLATRTGKLEDVLTVERELARVREEIERYEGRLRYLRSNVAVSTLVVSLSEPGPVVGEPGTHPIADAVRQAWRNFVGVVAGTIAALGGLIPLVVLVTGGLLAWRRWGKKPEAAPPTPA